MLPSEVDIFPMGLGSNLIIRDGGIRGIVVRLGRGFSEIDINGQYITVGASMLDSRVAEVAAESGIDLSFFKTIPGTIGGAIKMNAGCYGHSMEDVFVSAEVVSRDGNIKNIQSKDIKFSYRKTDLPEGLVIVKVTLKGDVGTKSKILQKMQENQKNRAKSQPIKEKTCGSTFRNPITSGPIVDQLNNSDLKAWELIDRAKMRGISIGGAKVSEMHPNFLINTGTATAENIESLGELIQKQVLNNSGIKLEWEVKRVGVRTSQLKTF